MSIDEQAAHDEAEQAAAFGAEFTEHGPGDTPAPEQVEQPTEAAAAHEPAEPPPDPGLTPAEQRALLAEVQALKVLPEQLRQVQGRYGELHRTLQQLQQGAEVSDADFDELRAEFPELADLTLKGMKKALGKVRPVQGVDLEPLKAEFRGEVTKLRQESEARLLSAYHRDWRQTVNTPEFVAWAVKQPADVQEQLRNSWDAEFLAVQIDAYKASRTAKTAPAAPNPKAKAIAAAVTPRGTAQPRPAADSEAEAFSAVFR